MRSSHFIVMTCLCLALAGCRSAIQQADHAITDGRDASERIDSVRAFTGQAFRAGRDVEPLLTLPPGSTLKLPAKAWEFKPTTPSRIPSFS